jgi:hypothetical protein
MNRTNQTIVKSSHCKSLQLPNLYGRAGEFGLDYMAMDEMFDEPQEDPTERLSDPADRAREKSDEFRMQAELIAVFEGVRKFDAQILPGLSMDTARDIQRSMARLEKSKSPGGPVLPGQSGAEAASVLNAFETLNLSTNDYHIHRRPGEVMIIRWLAGEQVDTFYKRLQAHFDVAIEGFREDEHQAHEWKQDPGTLKYLTALDDIQVKMAERHLRNAIRQHNLFVLSTQMADEINIAYLADQVMNVTPADIVGKASAPPDEPTEKDLAWFYKLFSLRGVREGVEQMCFFTFLQKTDEDTWA